MKMNSMIINDLQNHEKMIQYFIDLNISFNRHHLHRYIKFLSSRPHRHIDDYAKGSERHHILPISLFPDHAADLHNLIRLTVREHFLAHLMLAFAVGGGQWIAVNMFCKVNNPFQRRHLLRMSSRIYEKIRIENGKAVSAKIKKSRHAESAEQKQQRIDKWRALHEGKSEEERAASWRKRHETIRRKKLEDPSYMRNQKPRDKQCSICNVWFSHLHNCKGPKLVKQKPPKRQKPERAPKRSEFIGPLPKRVKKTDLFVGPPCPSKTSLFKCPHCDRSFRKSESRDKHLARRVCGTNALTEEQRAKEIIEKRRLTMEAKSPEEKAEYADKIRRKIKDYRSNMSEEEKMQNSENLRKSCLNYYNSDRYDPEIRGEQVRKGLNGENSKD